MRQQRNMVRTSHGRPLEQRYGFCGVKQLFLSGTTPLPFVLAHVEVKNVGPGSTRASPPEDAVTVQVLLQRLGAPQLRSRGQSLEIERNEAGSTFLFDLESPPVGYYDGDYNTLRLYMAKPKILEIARQNDLRWDGNIPQDRWGFSDPVLPGLLSSLLPSLVVPQPNALLVDHVMLAAHAYLVTGLAGGSLTTRANGGLASWQQNRVAELMRSRIASGVSLAELARECRLSEGHFCRAFRKTFGRTPHRVLNELRVEHAKMRLRVDYQRPISILAVECGFSDQSHLSRVFKQIAGISPAVWRREGGPYELESDVFSR